MSKANQGGPAGPFTPGPWRHEGQYILSVGPVDAKRPERGSELIAAQVGHHNAPLIAVAPDLYGTLQALAHMARLIERSANLLPGQIGYVTPEAVYRPAEEAIAKVEGRSAPRTPRLRLRSTVQPAVDNDHVAPGCQPFDEATIRSSQAHMSADPEKHAQWTDTDKLLFRRGALLDWCQALRDSHTGSGDPMPPGEREQVRDYMKFRLATWREPSDEWDTLVRALVDCALREYHDPATRNAAESRPREDPQP